MKPALDALLLDMESRQGNEGQNRILPDIKLIRAKIYGDLGH
jgi:hypothetical protein